MMMTETQAITEYLSASPHVEVAWLYGSRATGLHSDASDYDIAVALVPERLQPEERQVIVEDQAYYLRQQLSAEVSVVDINRVPVPLAYNIISQGKVLFCSSDLRLRTEQQRVWSLWAEYKAEHERNRTAL